MVAPVLTGLNDEDVRNALRVLVRHRPDRASGERHCRGCGNPYPCVPRRVAESVLDGNKESVLGEDTVVGETE
jgi:hypothetical protein